MLSMNSNSLRLRNISYLPLDIPESCEVEPAIWIESGTSHVRARVIQPVILLQYRVITFFH